MSSHSGLINDGTTLAQLANAAAYALEHFEASDRANAAIHMSQVRYSPVTFELAESLEAAGARGPVISRVLEHRGRYPLDPGRAGDDDKV